MREVKIKIPDNAASNVADILCWMKGYIDGKGEDWEGRWLEKSLNTIADINRQIKYNK